MSTKEMYIDRAEPSSLHSTMSFSWILEYLNSYVAIEIRANEWLWCNYHNRKSIEYKFSYDPYDFFGLV